MPLADGAENIFPDMGHPDDGYEGEQRRIALQGVQGTEQMIDRRCGIRRFLQYQQRIAGRLQALARLDHILCEQCIGQVCTPINILILSSKVEGSTGFII